jgi:ABC-type phosphate/phosphonate transport system permease subunit
MADITNHRWEYHSHASTVHGIVGVGSVDFELIAPLRLFIYEQVAPTRITIPACVVMMGTLVRNSQKAA